MAAKRKRVTLNEFKAWLEGVEELQPKDWCPTTDQWSLIRAKIDNIKEPVPQRTEVIQPSAIHAPVMQTSGVPVGITPPPPVGGLPVGQMVDMSPEAKAMMINSPGGKSVTPNIDTADGQYQSNFN